MKQIHLCRSVAISLAFAFILLAASTRADLLAYEGFNYTVGERVNGKSGGSPVSDYGWSGTWVVRVVSKDSDVNAIAEGGPSHNGVISTGNYATLPRDMTRTLGASLGGSGTLWTGFFMKAGAKGAAEFRWRNGADTMLSLTYSYNTSTKKFGAITFNGTATTVTGGTSWYYMLIRTVYTAEGATSTLWINPDLTNGEPPAETAKAVVSQDVPWTFNAIYVGCDRAQVSAFDEIRIATTFREAVRATQHINPVTIVVIQ